MTPIDDDILQAYVDGEIDAEAAAQVDAALAHDATLAVRVQRMREVNDRLRTTFDAVLDEAVPAHLSAMLQPRPATVTPIAPRAGSTRRGASGRRWFLPGAALAASVALLAVALWSWRSHDDLVRMHGGQTFAAGALNHALDESLASEPDAQAPVAIGLSFRSAEGHICRTFVLRAAPARAGLACHEQTGWTLPVLSVMAPSGSGDLRQAASSMPGAVQDAVDARLRGDVFNAQQERAARAAGWR